MIKTEIIKIEIILDIIIKERIIIIKKEIENLDLMNTTPIAALNFLFSLKEKIKKGE